MNHVAIDLGGRKSQVCVRDERGEIVEERVELTGRLGDSLRKQAPSVVILETCSEAFHVADLARAAGHKPIVVAATLVRSLGAGARRVKTDRRDAQILSEVSSRVDLSSVHIPWQKRGATRRRARCARAWCARGRSSSTRCEAGCGHRASVSAAVRRRRSRLACTRS